MGAKESAADRRGPLENEIAVFASSTTSQNIDLATLFARDTRFYTMRYVTIYSDQPIFYKWAHVNTATVDETQTSGATRCAALAAGVESDQRPAGKYFVFKLAAGGTPGLVRIWVSEGEPITGTPRDP